jgi:hypothetical protein
VALVRERTIPTERPVVYITIDNVRFEVLTAVTVKNAVLWDVTPCGSGKNRRFGEP